MVRNKLQHCVTTNKLASHLEIKSLSLVKSEVESFYWDILYKRVVSLG